MANKIQLYIANYLKYTILQFLQDIFDALFAILNEGAEQYGNLVFEALVSAYIYFNNYKLAWGPAPRWLDSSVDKAQRRCRRGRRFDSLKSYESLYCIF